MSLANLKPVTKYLLIRSLKNTLEDLEQTDRSSRNRYDIERIVIAYKHKDCGTVGYTRRNYLTIELI